MPAPVASTRSHDRAPDVRPDSVHRHAVSVPIGAKQAAREPVTVEVDFGSASSRGRRPDHSWMVRMRRGERSVIVAIGLTRYAADSLAEQIAELVAD